MKNSLQKFMKESLDTFSDSPEEIFGIIVGRILQGIYEIYSWLNFGKKKCLFKRFYWRISEKNWRKYFENILE